MPNSIIDENKAVGQLLNQAVLNLEAWRPDIFFEDFTLEKIFNEELSNKDVVFGNTVIKNEKYIHRLQNDI